MPGLAVTGLGLDRRRLSEDQTDFATDGEVRAPLRDNGEPSLVPARAPVAD